MGDAFSGKAPPAPVEPQGQNFGSRRGVVPMKGGEQGAPVDTQLHGKPTSTNISGTVQVMSLDGKEKVYGYVLPGSTV